jgi:hypothetical protein
LVQSAAAGAAQVPAPQVPRSTKRVPEQVADPQRTVGNWHTPSERPEQEPAHVASVPQLCVQQAPFEQTVPVTQPPGVVVQVWPRALLQTPLASHVPAQRPLGSARLAAGPQVWLVVLHRRQSPVQSASTQQPPAAMQVVVPPTVQEVVLVGQP